MKSSVFTSIGLAKNSNFLTQFFVVCSFWQH
jgi:hypothetical protein